MVTETSAFSGADRVIASYRLDDPASATPARGSAVAAAALWGVIRTRPATRMMVLRAADRVWVAAGRLLVEGKLGLNVGLLMPRMRQEPPAPAGTLPALQPCRSQRNRVLWNLAHRLARVEAPRVFLLHAGRPFRILATRQGIAIQTGDTLDDAVKAIEGALSAGERVTATLVSRGPEAYEPAVPVARLLAGPASDGRMTLSRDGWPLALPDRATLDNIAFARAVTEHLSTDVFGDDPKLQIFEENGELATSVDGSNGAWTVSGV